MAIPVFQVDAFTSIPFGGNPAAVCMLPAEKDSRWMQAVAAEMNLSETAFLVKRSDGFDLRWFTPAAEVDLCGHATLAGAHALWEAGYLNKHEEARFNSRSGLLTASYQDGWIELNFPVQPPEPAAPPAGLVEALGLSPVYVGKNVWDYIIEVEREEIVRNVQPDFNLLKQVDMRGVIVTSRADGGEYDFVSRFFAPAVGINEDPVTGSAHCCLTPYWAGKLGKHALVAYQASRRGGNLKVRLDGERVRIQGQAVTVFRGVMADEVE